MNTIGERIKFLRESKNLSMNKLEDMIGAPRGSVNKWEKGSIPGGNYLIALSDFFDVSTDWILKGETRREPAPENKQEESALFFDKKREVVSHFDNLIDSLGEQDRAFIDRYIRLAMLERQHENNEEARASKSEPAAAPIQSKSKEVPVVKEAAADYESPSAIPILGRAAAGVPIELVRFIEGYLRVPEKYKNCFAVRVDGESMVNAGIENGGYVVVRQQPRVDNNDIALVKVDDGVTIKRFKMYNDLAYLISENDSMRDMVYDPKEKDMQILGLIVDIISPKEAEKLVIDEL
ncbi:S24 family peptidase [Paenibacillus sp. DYY-L-2]|uniref:S24 family peptidase n=1 Tax=Paenibacillus sp. DYY-L-2 TaxID=3447013 RepID=UPI003F50B121